MTNRTPDGPDGLFFGSGRGTLSFDEFRVQLNLSDTATEPTPAQLDLAMDFATIQRRRYDQNEFRETLRRQIATRDGSVLMFVHGYNNSYQEALFRLAQISAGDDRKTVPLLFSWPSSAEVRGYVADRDAAMYARDNLVQTLIMLTDVQPQGTIDIIAHSMGAWLLMEAMRQLRLQGRDDVVSRLQVGLAAPDIDLDVFRSQIQTIGKLDPPLTVLVSKDDRALAISRRISGGRMRLGMVDISDPAVQKLGQQAGIRFVDLTSMPAITAARHDRFVAAAALYDNATRRSTLGQTLSVGAYALDASGRLLSSPFSATARILDGY
ncbi:alpha/beta hydrolase [Paracoccus sp. 11-3]|uniref:Alpha/beta hydrolase n=1 Tax=Paracoccus amoyensis TaxID=2760093 RepID=A0A926GNN6_9RHOB|nr:alpha/beta hydrolase [Paracoccus amoyensis]MBC9247175.1 alpha/beta hydrolase [Paracoccus amoyensis]